MKEKQKIQAIIFKKIGDKIQYLLLKRIPEKKGFWQPVTGRCEGEECHLDTAKREIKEETGISVVKRIVEDIYEFKFRAKSPAKEVVFGFEVEPETQILLDVNIYPEHDEFRWCDFNEAVKLTRWPQNKIALKKLNKILIKK